MSRYGRGTLSAGQRRFWKRALHHAATTDDRDMGNRPGVEFMLGLDGERMVVIDGIAVDSTRAFAALAHHWLTKMAA